MTKQKKTRTVTMPSSYKYGKSYEQMKTLYREIVEGKKHVLFHGANGKTHIIPDAELGEMLEKARQEGVKEALEGKVYNKVEITERANIPQEIIQQIKQEGREEGIEELKAALPIVRGEMMCKCNMNDLAEALMPIESIMLSKNNEE